MKSICDKRDKLEELHMKVMKWTTGGRQALRSLQEYKIKCVYWYIYRFDEEIICYLLREDVFQRLNWANFQLIDICDVILWYFNENVQIALERLLDSMENQLNTKQWEKHGKLCEVIEQILWLCKDRYYGMYINYESTTNHQQHQIYARLLDYLMKLIDICKDEQLIDSALSALRPFQFINYQSLLLKFIDSIGNQLNTDQYKREIQAKFFDFIYDVLLYFKRKELNQQTSNQLFDYLKKFIDRCDEDEMIVRAWICLREFPASQISSQVYQPLLQNYLQSSQLNLKMHRNWLSINLLRRYRLAHLNVFIDIFKQIKSNLWLEYLRKILRQCDHMPLVLIAILLLESMYLEGYLNIDSENIEIIKNELMDRVQSLDSECPLAHSLPDEFDFDRYQVEWCARWCVHNVMDRQKRWEMGRKLPLIKLSKDRFEARNYQKLNHFIPVRSQFAVSSGVYFYEVTVVTSGKMMFGWSSCDAEFNDFHWELNKFDVSQKFSDINYTMAKLFECQRSDVIGCLKDNRIFVLYCNGKEVVSVDQDKDYDNEQIIKLSSSPYYATAFLSRNQHCYFNFGQASFKYPPKNIQFIDFHKASVKDTRKYMLNETGLIGVDYWFKHLPVDNQVDLLYRDKRQNECDELVKRVERDIEEGREVEEIKKELGCTRYIQAIIEEIANTIQNDKIDLMTQWIGKVIEKTIDFVNKAKLVQLLYPYLHLRIKSTLDYTKHRNICIVLSNLIRLSERHYDFIKYIRKEVFTYLTRTLTETSDEWTQLFGLIALDYLKLSEGEKEIIRENNKFIEILNNNGPFKSENILLYRSPLSQQLHFSCEHLLTQVHSPPPPRPNPAALNSHDRTSHLKLSLDLFSARSDQTWQSVRSTGRVTKGIYYFEAVLLTNGPMRIGWSTKRTEIERTEVGGDEFSIAFDGYSRVVWHNDTKLELESSLERWKARDVVGCLVQVTRNRENNEKVKHFSFFLNGQLVSYKTNAPIYSSPHPYHASISLSAHQQVFLNFGQVQFQHPPEVDYLTFTHYPQDVTSQKSSINMNNNNITNAVISIESTHTIGNVSLINHTTFHTVDNISKPELTSSDPSNQNSLTKENSNKQKLLENDPALTQNSNKRFEVDQTDAHDSRPLAQSASVCEKENCKQKYAIQAEEITQLKLENAQLKTENAQLKTELKDKTIKADKYEELKLLFNK